MLTIVVAIVAIFEMVVPLTMVRRMAINLMNNVSMVPMTAALVTGDHALNP